MLKEDQPCLRVGDFCETEVFDELYDSIMSHTIIISYNAFTFGGSGTLVVYKGLAGILTASHVIAPIKNCRTISLQCLLREGSEKLRHLKTIPIQRILTLDELHAFSGGDWSDEFLDISFIEGKNTSRSRGIYRCFCCGK